MKSLIVYYSYTGNTKKVAQALKEALSQTHEVDIFELEPEDESDNFFIQAARALSGKKAVVKQVPLDVSGYKLVCIGSPVWAFAPCPAINTFLDGLKDINGKEAICFVTYGSGLGANRCLNNMKTALKKKGVFKLAGFKIQQFKVDDKDFVIDTIRQSCRLLKKMVP